MTPDVTPGNTFSQRNMDLPLIVAITGASGTAYGLRLISAVLSQPVTVHLIVSKAGNQVLQHENGIHGEDIPRYLKKEGVLIHPGAALKVWSPENLFAPPASGSFLHQGMAIAPCSMKTLGAIASGYGDDLIHRAADVCLKEKRPLVLLAREMPLSIIQIENMATVARAGATVMPASPGFYFKPKTVSDLVDSVVARVLDQFHMTHAMTKRWGEDSV